MDAMFFIVLGATLVSFLLTLAFGRFVIPMLRALHAGDRVKVELSPYDLTRGRITYRYK